MADGRTITIGGKQYMVTADMADALEAQEKEWKAKLDTPAAKPTEPTPAPTAQSIADRIFVDPDGVMKEVREQVRAEVLSEVEKRDNERRSARQAQRETEQFWTDFASAHSDLKGDIALAKVVLSEEQGQFQKFIGKNDDASKKECIDLIGDLTRKRIQAYIARTKESSGEDVKPNHPFVEGATLKFGDAQPRTTEGDKPGSLSDIIKARAEARRKGKAA